MYAVVQIGSMIFRSEWLTTRNVVCACAAPLQPNAHAANRPSVRLPIVRLPPGYEAAATSAAARVDLPSSITIRAAFSAIMMVGVFVLPEVMVGMTDASITRRPAT